MSDRVNSTLREKLGCWLHERWRAELVLRAPKIAQRLGYSWLDVCNRQERLHRDSLSGGRVCDWRDSSRLTLARVFPDCGSRLLHHALEEWPISFKEVNRAGRCHPPEITFLIPISGDERILQFELALATARAQVGIGVEIIVVEQSSRPLLCKRVPTDVMYMHQPTDQASDFNKSRALNRAASLATTENLILLDADLLVPRRFAASCARVLAASEAVRPARWIGYLDRASTEALAQTRDNKSLSRIEQIVANTPMPLAVRRATYWTIGGHDESYSGWGGEDTEFLDRLRTRNISEGGWMPILHAWHAPAPKKASGARNQALHASKMAESSYERIRRLVGGTTAGPTYRRGGAS